MAEPHFHDDRIVERVVERPRTRTVVERRAPIGTGTNWAALMLAALLTVFIVVLVFGYLL